MEILKNINLKIYNTFKIDCVAKYFYIIKSKNDFKKCFDYISKNKEYIILGSGSNILFKTKKDNNIFDGLIIKNEINFLSIKSETEENVILEVGSGYEWDSFAEYCCQYNYYGIENLSHIPGTVGAAPVQNIGAYGVEIKDYIQDVQCIDILESIKQNKIIDKTFTNQDCDFSYRYSIFKNQNKYFITSVTFRLSKIKSFNLEYKDTQNYIQNYKNTQSDSHFSFNLKDIRNMIINIRNSKMPDWRDPKSLGTAGSFFKNIIVSENDYKNLVGRDFNSIEQETIYKNIPAYKIEKIQTNPINTIGKMKTRNTNIIESKSELFYKLSSGYIIDKILNMKNTREGDVGTYKDQALIITNYKDATGQDIFDFSESIIQKCFDVTGLKLEREVNIF